MRLITVSVLSILLCADAFANARLPVVNVAAGSVSARAAFGEKIEKKSESQIVSSAVQSEKIESGSKAVVARAGVSAPIKAVSKDSGGPILASRADVLMPRRPSSDLWARMEKPLRLPEPQEISIIRADYDLPEEDLDTPRIVRSAVHAAVMPSHVVQTRSGGSSDLDSEIAKLVELQRRADESVKVVARKASSISSYDLKPTVASRAIREVQAPQVSKEIAKIEPVSLQKDTDVFVQRVVVPMDDNIIVRPVQNDDQPKFASVNQDMAKMSPGELKKAFKKTYLSENKHLSTFQIDDRFDVASDLSSTIEGFTSARDLSEAGGVRPLEIKIGFRGDDSALSRENYNLLSEYASIIVSNPKRAIQVSIPERSTRSLDDRKLAARRLAIVEQVLRDTGVSDQRIMPVLSQRADDSFVLRVISSDQYETLTQQKRDMFGDSVGKKTYKSMTW